MPTQLIVIMLNRVCSTECPYLLQALYVFRSLPPDQRETASTIMVFFLAFGLISGSATSFIWTKAVLQVSQLSTDSVLTKHSGDRNHTMQYCNSTVQ